MSDKPKRPRGPRMIPLLMLGSDGHLYACALVNELPASVLAHPHTVVAIRIGEAQRDAALATLQPWIKAIAHTFRGLLNPRS